MLRLDRPLRLSAVAALSLCAAAAGCQSYQPAPLDLDAHAVAWASRDAASPDVAAFARRLSAATTRPNDQAFDPADGLSLREAEVVALFFNPRLRAARLKARAAAVGAAEAGRWEDPVLRVDAERIIQAVEHPWVAGGMLDLTLPISGRLAAEKDRAAAGADVSRVNALVEEQRVLAELAAAWTELAVLDQRAALVRALAEDLEALGSQADRLRAAGELGPLEAGLFKVERVRQSAELRALAPQRRELVLAIHGLLGLAPDAPVRLVAALPEPVDPAAAADRRRLLVERHPRLRLARAEYDVAERTLALEVRKQFPDLVLGGGFGRDEGTTRVLGGLSLPIPVINGNRRAIAEARADRDAARATAEATYEELTTSLARAEASLAAARARREALEQELAPLADQQVKSARELGRLGAT
ncbi:MAG TPA: TolC family protein, partial [Humisphaera sp.]